MTLTKQDFITAPRGTIFHTKHGDKCLRWKVNGRCKVWKTRPDEFRLPVKHGLYAYDYITQDNMHMIAHREADCDND